MNIKSKNFEEAINIELNRSIGDKIEKEELDKIKNITLNQYDLSSKKTDVDLKELELLENLENLLLTNFEIDDTIVTILNSKNKLKNLQFTDCKFANSISFKTPFQYFVMDDCENLEESTFPNAKIIRVIGKKNFDLQKIKECKNVKKLYLQNCTIINFKAIKEFDNLTYLNLDGSKLDDTELLEEIKQNIEVDKKEKYYVLEGN